MRLKEIAQQSLARHSNKARCKAAHLANLLSHRGVNDSFNRKLTTIELSQQAMSRKKMSQVRMS